MPDAIKGTEGAFLRQRRNLVILSTLIFFLSASGTKISSDIFIFGTKLTVSRPNSIYFFIWLIWWWLFYRYYQYYKQEGAAQVKHAVNTRLASAVHHRLSRFLESQQPGKSSSEPGYRSCQNVRRQSFFRLDASMGKNINDSSRGISVEYNWESIEFRFIWRDIILTYYDFLMRRSEFTDYWFPMILSIIVFVYSNFWSNWDGSLWKLFHRS